MPIVSNGFADLHNHRGNTEPSAGDLYGLINQNTPTNGYDTRYVLTGGTAYAFVIYNADSADKFKNDFPLNTSLTEGDSSVLLGHRQTCNFKTLSTVVPIRQILSERFSPKPASLHAIGGGSINDCYRITVGNETVFCKVNSAAAFPQLFQKEKAGLEHIAKQGLIKTPAVIDCFESEGQQILLLEWIEAGERTDAFWKTFGEELAALHRIGSETFGLDEDNYMGSVPQSNRRHKSWTGFFAEERLRPMTQRCFEKGLLSKTHLRQFQNLEKSLDAFFEDGPPSLLHGDLWSGNFMCDKKSQPVLIDPAVYFGHRSMDLAMTTLFGGFRQPFYDAYNHHFLLPPNHREQWDVCNLYPLLIHLYLFGGGYRPQIERTLRQFD